MAGSFKPKFVDLVRNFTTSVGTGDIVPGVAVPGYTGLASALIAGDQFYYCVQGIDKVAEREVGRGTLQADGTIARQPIAGAKTDFSSGTKTVALVAAAEWFARLDAGSAAGGAGAAADSPDAVSRTVLAAQTALVGASTVLTEPGREGLFVYRVGNFAARVAADPRQGLYVAPATDATGASGAWVRLFDGAANLLWFGAVADDNGTSGTDNSPAIAAALGALAGRKSANDGSIAELRIPQGNYFCAQTINLINIVRLTGEATGQSTGTRLRFAANTNGIVINRPNTLGDTVVTSRGVGADGSIIEGIALRGGGGTSGSGIRFRARGTVRNCNVQNFGMDGANLEAYTGGAATAYNNGNANNWRIENSTFNYNGRHGVYCWGSDPNAGTGINVDASANACGGIMDYSFLGNVWVGCHAELNGRQNIVNTLPIPCVNYGPASYVVALGRETAAATTTPGTDPAVWIKFGDYNVGTFPNWTSGIAVRAGAPYGVAADVNSQSAPNNRSRFYGCYAEGGQPVIQMYGAAMFDGFGAQAVGYVGQGFEFVGEGNRRTFSDGIETRSGAVVLNDGAVNFHGASSLDYGVGKASLCRHPALGLALAGEGSAFDLFVGNKSGAQVLTVATGTQNVAFAGNITVAGTITAAGGGGGGGLSDGDKGDVVVSGGGATLTVESASPASGRFAIAGSVALTANVGFSAASIYKSAVLGLAVGTATGSAFDFFLGTPAGSSILTVATGTTNIDCSGDIGIPGGKAFRVNGAQVVGGRGAAVADATDAASAISQLNALLARVRAHGLIA